MHHGIAHTQFDNIASTSLQMSGDICTLVELGSRPASQFGGAHGGRRDVGAGID